MMLKFMYSKPLPKEIARDRLKFIIINDRDGITPYVLDIIKNEIITIMTKYVNIDTNDVSVDLVKNREINVGNDSSSLIVTIPLHKNCGK